MKLNCRHDPESVLPQIRDLLNHYVNNTILLNIEDHYLLFQLLIRLKNYRLICIFGVEIYFNIYGENNNIIQFSNMGCTSTRDEVYEIKHPQISNRDINETRCDLQVALHNLPPQACGYQFGINVQNSDPYSSPNKQKAKQQAELDRFNHLMDVYKEMETHFSSSRIDQAYHLQQQLREIYKELNFTIIPELESDKREKMFDVAESVEDAYIQLKLFQKQLLNQEWQENYEEDLLKVKYHRGKDACKVMVEAEVDVCIQLMTATFGSFSRYQQFMKFVLSSKQIKKKNIFKRLGEITYDLPFCSQNVAYFQQVVIDRLSVDNSIVIGYQSLFKNSKLYERLEFYPAYQIEPKIDFPKIVCKLEPIQSRKTKATLVFVIKGEMEPIADWVVDKLYKNIGVASIKKLIDKAKAFGEDTDTEIFEGDDQLYHHFHSLMKANEKKVMD